MATKPILRLYQIGCTSGHDSLIQVWVPETMTEEALDALDDMWQLSMRVMRKSAIPKFSGFNDIEAPLGTPGAGK